MTAPLATACPVCLGDEVVVLEQRGVDVALPCPGCQCPTCGRPPMATGALCEECEDAAALEFDRRAERRADR